MILDLIFVSFLPVAASIAVHSLEKTRFFDKTGVVGKQIIIGLIFGAVGLAETFLGAQTGDYKTNIRDAAPMCAGILFGAPAGIIAGVISGIERIIAYQGIYTANLVGGIATILIALYTAVFRIFIFENKKPSSLFVLIFALVGETIHFLLVFFFFPNDVIGTFIIIKTSAPIMISLTAASVFLSTLFIRVISKQVHLRKKTTLKLLSLFQHGLIICIVAAFGIKILFNFSVQNKFCITETENLLKSTITDIELDISDFSDKNLLLITEKVAEELNNGITDLDKLTEKYFIDDISVIDSHGIITESTVKSFIGYNMYSGEQSREFCVILDGKDSYVQKYQPLSIDKSIERKFCGKALKDGGFVQVGYSFDRFKNAINDIVEIITLNRHAGNNGYTFICDDNFNLVGYTKNFSPKMYDADLTKKMFQTTSPQKIYSITANNQKFYSMYTECEGYVIIASIDYKSAVFGRDISFYITLFMDSIVFLTLFVFIFIIVKVGVINNINKITCSLGKIVNGNLETKVNVHATEEFSSLSSDINSTVNTLKGYMREIETRNQKELDFAKKIQYSVLPAKFPSTDQFDLFASMDTAKEVGGDFYDFFMIDDKHLAMVIADVSGKGIPAALFMMESRTIIHTHLKQTCDPATALIEANNEICENNPMEMFVTVFASVLDLETKTLTFANAGHEKPALCKVDGSFELLKTRSGFVIGGMPGMKYVNESVQLEKGDIFYTYTDGIPEAINEANEEFGNDRLISSLNSNKNGDLKSLCKEMYNSVTAYAGTAPQFDDITMMALQLK